MKVGDFGVGGSSSFTGDVDTLKISGFYTISSAATGDTAFSLAHSMIVMVGTTTRMTQIASFEASGNNIQRVRVFDGTTWTPWREIYHQGSILGTVSESSGTPTGAIIERGSNSNGEYVKFADGTLICTRITPETIDISGAVIDFTYPASIIEPAAAGGFMDTSSGNRSALVAAGLTVSADSSNWRVYIENAGLVFSKSK